MAIQNDILAFATKGQPFTLKELLAYLESNGIDFNRRSVSTQLGRTIKRNLLRRVKRGCFTISDKIRKSFLPFYNSDMAAIADIIRASYPFMDICVWSLEDIKRLSHYASNRDLIYVEVDRDETDGVFTLLSETFPDKRVFVNPTEDEYGYYINGHQAIVIKPLRTEAPCIKDKSGILHPTLEKIMVDIVADADFTPWQGYETTRLYDNILSIYNISTTKLMRYARRRGKSERIAQLISNH